MRERTRSARLSKERLFPFPPLFMANWFRGPGRLAGIPALLVLEGKRKRAIWTVDPDARCGTIKSIFQFNSNNSINFQGATDQWLIRSDFEANGDGQLTVKSGEKVEVIRRSFFYF